MKVTAFLCTFDMPATAILLLNLLYLLGSFAALSYEYFVKRAYYNELFAVTDRLDKKYYIAEVLGSCVFAEGRILAETLRTVGKSMNDELSAERKANREYREYVELWVHEIKTPVSAIKLICDHNGYANILRRPIRSTGL